MRVNNQRKILRAASFKYIIQMLRENQRKSENTRCYNCRNYRAPCSSLIWWIIIFISVAMTRNYELGVQIAIRASYITIITRECISIVFCDDEGTDYKRRYLHLCIKSSPPTFSRYRTIECNGITSLNS